MLLSYFLGVFLKIKKNATVYLYSQIVKIISHHSSTSSFVRKMFKKNLFYFQENLSFFCVFSTMTGFSGRVCLIQLLIVNLLGGHVLLEPHPLKFLV